MQNQMKEQVDFDWARHVESWKQSGLSQRFINIIKGLSKNSG